MRRHQNYIKYTDIVKDENIGTTKFSSVLCEESKSLNSVR